MKKTLYSIGLVCAILFTACSEDKGTSTEVADSNDNVTVDPNNINDYDQPGTAGSTTSTQYTDATYQQSAQEVTDQMRSDLQLDDATATEVTKIYYNRNRQLGDLEQGSSFSSTERMGGRTNETRDMNGGNTTGTGTGTDMNNNNTMGNNADTNNMGNTTETDRSQIDKTTDRELRNVLTPEQYRKYEQNRDRYNNIQFDNNNNINNNSGTDLNRGTNNTGTNSDMNRGTGTDRGTGTNSPTRGNQ